jgi:hypothetical protein
MSVTLVHSTLNVNHKAKRTEHNSKKPRKNFIQKAAKRLLTASACVREQRNTTEEKQKARKKTPIKTHPNGCLPQAFKKAEHTCMPA